MIMAICSRALGLDLLGRRDAGRIGALALACTCVILPPARAELPAESAGLRNLFMQFQMATSLSFRSSVLIQFEIDDPSDSPEIRNAVGTPVKGEVEFSASGNRYHFASRADAEKLPSFSNSVAFDGDRFQVYFGVSRTLSVSFQDKAGILPMLPNPYLELLQFRYPITDENEGTYVRFREVQEDHVPNSFWEVTWSDVSSGSGGTGPLKRAEFPGATYQGLAYVHHVYAPAGDGRRPIRIDRVASGGQVLTTAEFRNFEDVGSGSTQTCWPHQVRLIGYQANGAPAVTMTFQLESLSVNADVSNVTFRINAPVRVRWDDDQHVFVPTPEPG